MTHGYYLMNVSCYHFYISTVLVGGSVTPKPAPLLGLNSDVNKSIPFYAPAGLHWFPSLAC